MGAGGCRPLCFRAGRPVRVECPRLLFKKARWGLRSSSARKVAGLLAPGRGLDHLAPDPGRGRGERSRRSGAIHDRDRAYGADFATRLAGLGVESIRTPVQAPRANANAKRLVRSLRQECLDHILPLSERHVRAVLAEFVTYYSQDRPHRSLTLKTPAPSPRQLAGKVVSRPVLNGLHHVSERAARLHIDFCRPTPVKASWTTAWSSSSCAAI